jgi:hypothetical protein
MHSMVDRHASNLRPVALIDKYTIRFISIRSET